MRLLFRDEKRYEQVLHSDEREFQRVVEQQLRRIWPAYIILPFETYITGDEGIRRKPDFAAIHKSFNYWYVIEVELLHHSLHNHVKPQVAAFSTGRYNDHHADFLTNSLGDSYATHVKRLIRYSFPETIVVVDSATAANKGWDVLEKEYIAHLTYLEIFRSEDGDPIFCLSGFQPTIQLETIMSLRKHQLLNALCGKIPGNFAIPTSNKLKIEIENTLFECDVVKTADELLVFLPNFVDAAQNRNYSLLKTSSGSLRLQLS